MLYQQGKDTGGAQTKPDHFKYTKLIARNHLLTRGKLVFLQCFCSTTPNGSFPADGCLLLHLQPWLLVTTF